MRAYPPTYNGNPSIQTKPSTAGPHPVEYNAWVSSVGNNYSHDNDNIVLKPAQLVAPQNKPEYVTVLPEKQYVYARPVVQNAVYVKAPRYVLVNPGAPPQSINQRVIDPSQNTQYVYQS